MAKLSEKAKKIIAEVFPAYVATASKNGKPNVAPKGSFRILDDEHVCYVEMATLPARTYANLKENPQIMFIFCDPAAFKVCRVWGKVEEILESGELVDEYKALFASVGSKNVPKYVVKVAVEEEDIL